MVEMDAFDSPSARGDVGLKEGARKTHRRAILDAAGALIDGDRQSDYGPPSENFKRIADMWSPIFGKQVTMAQVALALAAVKLARLIESPDKQDSWIDLAGYAALGSEVADLE